MTAIDDFSVVLNDVLIAIQYYQRSFPNNLGCPPIVLMSQLYSSVKNRTNVDREVSKLIAQKKFRSVRLHKTANDYAIIDSAAFESHLKTVVESFIANSSSRKRSERENIASSRWGGESDDVSNAVGDKFGPSKRLKSLLQSVAVANNSATHKATSLAELASSFVNTNDSWIATTTTATTTTTTTTTTTKDTAIFDLLMFFAAHSVDLPSTSLITLAQLREFFSDDAFTIDDELLDRITNKLLDIGVLLPNREKNVQTFYISVPGTGVLLSSLLAGRKELIDFVRRRKYNEVLLDDLPTLFQFKQSKLPPAFVVKDLVGQDCFVTSESTSGTLIRLKQK